MDKKTFRELSKTSPWKIAEETKVKMRRNFPGILISGLCGLAGSSFADYMMKNPVTVISALTWGAIWTVLWFFYYGGYGYLSIPGYRWRLLVHKIQGQPAGEPYLNLAEERKRQLCNQSINLSIVHDLESEMCSWWEIACKQANFALDDNESGDGNHVEATKDSARQLLEQSVKARQAYEKALVEADNITTTG